MTDHMHDDAQSVGVPDGWKLVPLIPTERMIEVGCDNNPTQWNEGTDHGFPADVASDIYVSMVRAAQPPAAPVETISDEGVIKAAGAMVRLGQERRRLEAPMPTRGEEARACIETYLAFLHTNSPQRSSAGNAQAAKTAEWADRIERTTRLSVARAADSYGSATYKAHINCFYDHEAKELVALLRSLNEPQGAGK